METKCVRHPVELMPGLSVSPLSTGMVRVRLHYSADPVISSPENLDTLAAMMGGRDSWRWAKEMELDFEAQSGEAVFDRRWLDRQRKHVRTPLATMDIDSRGRLVRRPNGRVRIFMEPDDLPAGLPETVESLDRTFGIGMDVGAGTGASDSTIQVFCVQGREQAAAFNSNRITPSDLGRLAVAVARYYNDALICCVQKMHGITAIRAMVEAGYPHIWQSRRITGRTEERINALGWPKGELTDKELLDRWIDALASDPPGTVLHDFETLEQHRQYLYDEMGRPALSRMTVLNVTARQQHGDLVVACALANRACMDLPRQKNVTLRRVDWRCFEGRLMEWKRKQMQLAEQGW